MLTACGCIACQPRSTALEYCPLPANAHARPRDEIGEDTGAADGAADLCGELDLFRERGRRWKCRGRDGGLGESGRGRDRPSKKGGPGCCGLRRWLRGMPKSSPLGFRAGRAVAHVGLESSSERRCRPLWLKIYLRIVAFTPLP